MASVLRTLRELYERNEKRMDQFQTNPTTHDAALVRNCERCGHQMSLLATMAKIVDRPMLHVFRCLPCGRIASTPSPLG